MKQTTTHFHGLTVHNTSAMDQLTKSNDIVFRHIDAKWGCMASAAKIKRNENSTAVTIAQ
jgi:hypothetical protein